MTIKNVVLEIGTEEMPSRFLPDILETLEKVAREDLEASRIGFETLSVFATPRRIVLMARGMEEKQKDLVNTFRGPAWNAAFDAAGNPTRAAHGFARSRGVSVEQLTPMEVDGVRYTCAEVSEPGSPALKILPVLFPALIRKLVFPKNMYWADPAVRFSRPIRWIFAMAEDKVIPFEYGGIKSGRTTSGHRFLGTKTITINDAADFMNSLRDNYVILDQEERRKKMLSGISALENELEGVVELDPEIVNENLYLVEYPVPFFGSFDEKYLGMPEEVLATSMKKNQKYFSVRGENEKLLPFFVGVSNNLVSNMTVVREGNERVLKARLEDAAFFWSEDLKVPLASNVERLKNIVYQEKLGSLHDKVMCTRELAVLLCRQMGLEDLVPAVDRAAYLSKADLVTNMVYEFPDLQGIMGREYALKNGEPERVAKALSDQYLPRAAGGALPGDVPGAILGLAERIYIIVSSHKAGLDPTGSQDPYGLRRAARCINEIIWGLGLDVDISWLVARCMELLSVDEEVGEKVFSFLSQRLLMQVKERGYGHESAALALSVTGGRPLQVIRFLEVFSRHQGEDWFTSLVTSAVRVRNILAKSEDEKGEPDPSLFVKEEEKTLYGEVQRVLPLVEKALEEQDWSGLAEILAELSPPVSAFFDDVLVMDKDEKIKANRIALLALCNSLFLKVGDLGMLKGA
ncbi:MAG: glycine--tRNA ligase subunit beta [Aminivibrio sp.]